MDAPATKLPILFVIATAVSDAMIDTLLAVEETVLPTFLIVVSTFLNFIESASGADKSSKTLSIGLKNNDVVIDTNTATNNITWIETVGS